MAQQTALLSPPCKSRKRKTSPFFREIARTPPKPDTATEEMLRDMAFVYHLTRSLRNTMLMEPAGSGAPTQ
jgi:hypothetical protein